ncbi:MAG: phycoerythrobilin:ferredoxin oxidoreductase [Pseudanabaenaceae cyanobacterium SKYGB_i_bin29]|nr:phycoerythrobilin:ferredoxin oxidoreductase [Pseudanabaenaceae cyanobacterium SKYG29]MDW8420954.1 phycoerythrobilin:ferredoxin oxidoreductase [Pseudanabaenaceae cyanobacterium SKYGB_i_bin29]
MSLYKPFLDYALNFLQTHFPCSPYPIPPGFAEKSALVGKGAQPQEVKTTSYALQTEKLRQIRAAHVEGGQNLQVLNFVIFPRIAYDLPFFGADLVTLPGGHLIAIDMQPLFRDDPDYQAKYAQPVLAIHQRYQAVLPWGGDFPQEAACFFSPAFLWTRPKDTHLVETVVFQAFQEYLHQYGEFVARAEPVPEEKRSLIAAAQQRYLDYRAAKDPARGMFTRFYGKEWTEAYIHGFLFTHN